MENYTRGKYSVVLQRLPLLLYERSECVLSFTRRSQTPGAINPRRSAAAQTAASSRRNNYAFLISVINDIIDIHERVKKRAKGEEKNCPVYVRDPDLTRGSNYFSLPARLRSFFFRFVIFGESSSAMIIRELAVFLYLLVITRDDLQQQGVFYIIDFFFIDLH